MLYKTALVVCFAGSAIAAPIYARALPVDDAKAKAMLEKLAETANLPADQQQVAATSELHEIATTVGNLPDAQKAEQQKVFETALKELPVPDQDAINKLRAQQPAIPGAPAPAAAPAAPAKAPLTPAQAAAGSARRRRRSLYPRAEPAPSPAPAPGVATTADIDKAKTFLQQVLAMSKLPADQQKAEGEKLKAHLLSLHADLAKLSTEQKAAKEAVFKSAYEQAFKQLSPEDQKAISEAQKEEGLQSLD